MSVFFKTIKNYFKDPESNLFSNYIDALLGSIVLLLFPILSLISVFFILDNANLLNYVFPLSSICIAGAYDTYGRYMPKNPKNIKLGIRLVFEFCVIIISLIAVATKNQLLVVLAPSLLVIPGFLILHEVYNRVVVAVKISKWYAS